MALPTFQAIGTVGAGTGDITPTWPTHQADDVGLLICETGNGEAVTAPTGWVAVGSSPQDSGGTGPSRTRLSVFWFRATGSSETDPTITDPGNHVIGQILTFRGVVTTGDPWHISAGAAKGTADTTMTFPGGTTTIDDCLITLIGSHGDDEADAVGTVGTGGFDAAPTERLDRATGVGNDGMIFLATAELASQATFAAVTATMSTSERNGNVTLALQPVASGDASANLTTIQATVSITAVTTTTSASITTTAVNVSANLTTVAITASATANATAINVLVTLNAPTQTASATANLTAVNVVATLDPVAASSAHQKGLLMHYANMIG